MYSSKASSGHILAEEVCEQVSAVITKAQVFRGDLCRVIEMQAQDVWRGDLQRRRIVSCSSVECAFVTIAVVHTLVDPHRVLLVEDCEKDRGQA